MVATPQKERAQVELLEVDVASVKVSNRLRATSDDKVAELAESIEQIGLLHPITVSKSSDGYLLLSGHHRLQAFRLLGRRSIPATLHASDELLQKMIEVSENLIRSDLNAIQTAEHIILREELLTQLGRRVAGGENKWTRGKNSLTTEDLARSMGMKSRAYQYKKSIANLHPEVKDILNETEFATNMMDMVTLSKESDDVQLMVANLLVTGKCRRFKNALKLSRIKCHNFDWSDEQKRVREEVGKSPSSVMRLTDDTSDLSKLCNLVSQDDECKVLKREWGSQKFALAQQHPDLSAFFVNYYTKEGDVVCDPFAGRGTNVLVASALGRKVVGYDLSTQNLEKMREVALEHTDIKSSDLTLHHSCGVELAEYANDENIFDLVSTDPPFIFGAEQYGEHPKDLCLVKELEPFNDKMEECLLNLKRLIKPSHFKQKVFHPIVFKVGSGRRSDKGLIDMATELEIIGRRIGLTLHDKIINHIYSAWGMFNTSRCIDNRYTVKVHETCLVFVKY